MEKPWLMNLLHKEGFQVLNPFMIQFGETRSQHSSHQKLSYLQVELRKSLMPTEISSEGYFRYQQRCNYQSIFQKLTIYSIPLCLAYPDRSGRETQKSKRLEVIAPGIPPLVDGIDIDREQTVFIIDMIAQIRVSATNTPDNFKEFILKFIQSIPKGYQRVHIVADTYKH